MALTGYVLYLESATQQDINLAIIVVIIRAITDNKLHHHLKPTDSYATRFYD